MRGTSINHYYYHQRPQQLRIARCTHLKVKSGLNLLQVSTAQPDQDVFSNADDLIQIAVYIRNDQGEPVIFYLYRDFLRAGELDRNFERQPGPSPGKLVLVGWPRPFR